jgi:dynamin 1-like protein
VRGQTQEKKGARYSGPFVSEIRHRLDSYFDVMIRNVRDLVPKAIGFYLVRAVVDKMQFELLNSLNKDDKISELLGEPPHILEERKQLNTQRLTLQKAHGVLTRDPTLAAIAFEAEMEEEESGTSEKATAKSGPSGSSLLSKGTAALSSAASATASAASTTANALRQQAEKATSSATSAIQQQATNAAVNAMQNPAVQRQVIAGATQAARDPAVQKAGAQGISSLLGDKNPLSAQKKSLFD